MTSEELQKTQTACLVVLATVAILYGLYSFQGILIPLVFSTLILIPLYPLAQSIHRKLKINYSVSVVIVISLLMFGFFTFGRIAYFSFSGLSQNISVYQNGLNKLNHKLEKNSFVRRFIDTPSLETTRKPEKSVQLLPTKTIQGMILKTTNFTLNFFSNLVLIFIFLLFMMLGVKDRKKGDSYIGDIIEDSIKSYILVKTTISFATGLLTFLVLNFFQIDYAIAFGLFAFLLNFIPSIGSIFAVLLPLPVIVFNPEMTWVKFGILISLMTAIQFSIGNILEPKVMGNKLKLHPIVILIALLFWGSMWGIPGMFLAVPLTVFIKINSEHRKLLKPLGPILEGNLKFFSVRPPQT